MEPPLELVWLTTLMHTTSILARMRSMTLHRPMVWARCSGATTLVALVLSGCGSAAHVHPEPASAGAASDTQGAHEPLSCPSGAQLQAAQLCLPPPAPADPIRPTLEFLGPDGRLLPQFTKSVSFEVPADGKDKVIFISDQSSTPQKI